MTQPAMQAIAKAARMAPVAADAAYARPVTCAAVAFGAAGTAPGRGRRGISLLEVLFSIGVLTVGILSMAALLPLGAYELRQAKQMDDASTLGRAAFRDLEIRGYLRPETWVDTQSGMLIDPTSGARLLTYPYMPVLNNGKACGESYYNPTQNAATAPLNTNQKPNSGTQPHLYPQTLGGWPLGETITSFISRVGGTTPPYPPFSAAGNDVFVIDPLMVSYTGASYLGSDTATVPASPPSQWTSIQRFPYQSTYSTGAPLIPRLTVLPTWPISLPAAAQAPIWPSVWSSTSLPRFMPYAMADRLFRSNDDLIFNEETSAARDRPAATSGSAINYTGAYSWFVTIAPTISEVDSLATNINDPVTEPSLMAANTARQYSVSVVVCRNRQLDVPASFGAKPPGEWMVPARITGGGLSGGEVALFVDTTQANSPAWLGGLKPGNWIMLSAITLNTEIRSDPTDTFNPYKYWPRFRTIANWYRIVAVDDGSALGTATQPGYRFVTLHGPDWPVGTQWDDPAVTSNSPPVVFSALAPANGMQFVNLTTATSQSYPPFSTTPYNGTVYIYAYATVVEGVVGVFQKTVTIDGDSPWALP